MAQVPAILAANGQPLRGAYESGDRFSREMYAWQPLLRSPDAEILPDLSLTVARTRDLIRNYGLASGAVQTHLDNVIGAGLRLQAKPDYQALGLSADWAAEWSERTEARFRQWAYDIDRYCDAGRRLTLSGMLGQGYRSYLSSGEILNVAEWLPGRGGAYATAIQSVASERLCNPDHRADSARLRGGIELDADGAPVAYHIRAVHPADPWANEDLLTWRRVPAATPWGRRQVIHIYDQDAAGQTRGISKVAASLATNWQLNRFERTTLEAAVVNAMYAAVIESDLASAVQAVGGMEPGADTYMEQVAQFWGDKAMRFDGVKIPHLYPGEKLSLLRPGQPTDNFAPFEEAFLRHLAGGWNLSYEQLARDYSKTNYSGARAGLLESWKHFQARRGAIAGEQATQIYALWLEEDWERRDDIPDGAPDFWEAKTAWCGCEWIGPGKGNIDPLKETKADTLEVGSWFSTLSKKCAERGDDWQAVVDQGMRERAYIRRKAIEHGLDPDAALGELAQQVAGAPDTGGGEQ